MNNFDYTAPAYSVPLVIVSPELPSLRDLHEEFWNAWRYRTDAHETGTARCLQAIYGKFNTYDTHRSAYYANKKAFNLAMNFFVRNEHELPMGGAATIERHRDLHNNAFVAFENLTQETAGFNWTLEDQQFHRRVASNLDSIRRQNDLLRDSCDDVMRRSGNPAAPNRQQPVGEAQALHPRLPPPYTASFFGMPPSVLNSMAPGGVASTSHGPLPRGAPEIGDAFGGRDVQRRRGFPS